MTKNLFSIFSLALVLAACTKKNDLVRQQDNPPTAIAIAVAKYDSTVAGVAGVANQLLKVTSFRHYLKKEVLKTFDGDYDVLLSTIVKHLKRNVIKNSSGLSGISERTDISAAQINYLEMIADEYPLMQLSVQVSPENWNPDEFVPPVTYLSGFYDEATTTQVPVVDDFGNTIGHLDAQVEPDFPVVVVSENERTIVSPTGDVVLSMPVSSYSGYTTDIMGVDSLQPISPNAPIQWYRQNFKYESVYALRYDEIGRIEGWPAGGPETRIFTYSLENPTSLTYLKQGYYHGEKWAKRKDVKDSWFVFDQEPVTCHLWRWSQSGTTMKFAFYEYDSEPFRQEHADSLANFVTSITDSSATGTIIASGLRLVGLFLPKEGRLSEFIGELEISANNNAVEFRKGTGGFAWRSKPY